MTGMMIGAAAQRRPKERQVAELDYNLMRESGIDHVRLGIRPPFTDASMTTTSAAFQEQEREIERIDQAGLKVMAFSPFPGGDADIGGQYPAWGGEAGSETYLDQYEAVCGWLAERFRGVVDAWQIANEMNRPFWNGGLDTAQSIAFLQRGGRGVRRGNPEAQVGFNMAGFDEIAMAMYARLLAPSPAEVDFDYIGCDGYMEPDRWPEKFAQLAGLSDKPIIVQEFGYASEGITLTEKQSREHPFRTASDRCRWLGWMHMWGGRPHTPETQAEYIARCMEHFIAAPRVTGVIVWRWDDAPACWLCGRSSSTCPGTGRWGMVDEEGRPKPALDAFRDGAERLKRRALGEEVANRREA